jgi:hypothetical protein
MVDCVGDIAKHLFECRHMLYSRSLHEETEIPDREDQIRPGVDQIVEAANELAVQGCIFFFSFAITTQFEPLFHLRLRWIAIRHPCHLQYLHGIVCLAQTNVAQALLDLQSLVKTEQTKISNVGWSRPREDEIVDIHTDDEPPTSASSTVHGMLMIALAKPKFA